MDGAKHLCSGVHEDAITDHWSVLWINEPNRYLLVNPAVSPNSRGRNDGCEAMLDE